MITEKKRLGNILIDAGKITPEQLEEALQYQKDHNVYLGKAVIMMGLLTEKEMLETLSEQLGIPSLELVGFEVQDEALKLVDEKLARTHKIMPLFLIDGSLTIATSDPLNVQIVDELNNQTGLEIILILASESEIEQTADLYYTAQNYAARTTQSGDGQQVGIRVVSTEIGEDTAIVETVNMLFDKAIRMGASDIHIEPREQDVRMRFRVDGVLQQYYTVSKGSMAPLISRIKVLSGIDITESRKPQDGRFSYISSDHSKVDVRCSTYPTAHGEKAVMRILDESRRKFELHKLGFTDETLEQWMKIIHTPNGIIMVTGPTGSGKTTTLYATLNVVNTVETNVMTIEDPIEYALENISQGQVNVKAGLTFSSALRSMLRQDPDIIMVGEMRDIETIELAIRSALTGHLVFSTLHTNDAASSFTRLLDMGIDAYLVTSTVRAVLAQRLIRLLCPRCKKKVELTDDILMSLGITADFKGAIYKPDGCLHCKNSGYFGRSGVYELLKPDEEISSLVIKQATGSEIEKIAVRKGMMNLREAALHYVLDGRTSIEEMIRVTEV